MSAPRIRLTVDESAVVPLRFDDPAFLEALDADAHDESGDIKSPLARALDVKKATDYDFTPYVDEGYVLYARPTVPGKAEDDIFTEARRGDGVDIAVAHARRWSLWITKVDVSAETREAMDRRDVRVLDMLASRARKAREDGFNELPREVRQAFSVRLRVHADAANRPAERDPGKAEGQTEAW